MSQKPAAFLLIIIFLISPLLPLHAQEEPNLHVPSPAWEDQIIYFVMTDRFNDGDPSNNDQGAGEYDPADPRKYSGGDIQGIIDQLDYIQSLGATAIWITPPVANQWWDPLVQFSGYHGYWAENFKEVDPHLGTLEDYQALSDALHDRGMYLIQDIVTNHTGNFFTYVDEGEFTLNTESVPVTAPSQPPFDQNDFSNPDDQAADIYHWTPTIQNFDDPTQLTQNQLADLDDLNTENPVVVDALIDSYNYWITEVGVDGFRIDTVKHVDHPFWNTFVHSENGINATAASTGRENFLTFGEALIGSDFYSDTGEREVASFLGTEDAPELASVLHFPLHFTINRVFAEGLPTDQMTYRLEATERNFPNPAILPVFIDNHDVARFLERGNVAGLKQALLFMLTSPGIPVIYYGTEQAFDEQRAAMFAEGWGSGGEDQFNTESELYRHIQTLTELRKSDPLFSRGTISVLQDNPNGAGVFAYQREYEGEKVLVLLNTSDQPTLMVDLDTGLPAGTVLESLFGIANQEDLTVGADGKITRILDAREGMVLRATDELAEVASADLTITVETPLADQVFSEDIMLTGTASIPNTPLQLIVNSNAARAIDFSSDAEGNWSVQLPLTGFPPGESESVFTIYAPELQVASPAYPITTNVVSAGFSTTVFDPMGDDVGPNHVYTLPSDASFGDQLDIQQAQVAAVGNNLQITLQMSEITDIWTPSNGFDHVLFNVFIDVPGKDGISVLPFLNADAPLAWDYHAFIEGWNNRLYSAEGASADAYGAIVNPAPEISVDKDARTISFMFSAEALGNPESLDGTQVYITTWDWDGPAGTYRGLTEAAGQWTFGGGDGSTDPLIFDQTDVITLTSAARIATGDPAGDDVGAEGRYILPTDASFGDQMDILEAGYSTIGTNLEVYVRMADVTQIWTPANGFDHVLFNVFIDLPGAEGATVLPNLNATAPEGFAWDVMGFIEGWTSRIHSAEGATAEEYGATLSAAPEITVNDDANTIRFLFSAEALGNPETLEGTKLYITTWDWDGPAGNYRYLNNAGGQWGFGGGDDTVDPLILDDVLVGVSPAYMPPPSAAPMTAVTFAITSVPANTPTDATYYLAGEFNSFNPNDERFQFVPDAEGIPTLTLEFEPGTAIQYRITRGSWGNAEKFNPDDRFANHELTVGEADQVVEHEIPAWWDD